MRRYAILLLGVFFLTSSAACAHKAQNFYFGNYSEAERLYSKGQYEKAIEKYQAYRDENPEGNLAVIAEYYMAKSYQALGKKDDARKYYQEIAQKHPDLVWANFSNTQLKELETAAPAA
ncbi:MAG TPA: tetratricopeptide repeat protein [Verrucomicrobiae bacterium]|jgi:TolA-binding protein|nr:tetratricopeptide repeat protein [Verrucomicrobiae bacterium]